MSSSQSRHRWLLILLGLLTLYHVVDLFRLARLPDEILDTTSLPIAFRLVTGVTWVGLFAWGMLGVVRGYRGGVRRARYLIVGFVLYTVARLVVFTRAEYDRQRLPFVLAVLAFLMITFVVVRLIGLKPRRHHDNLERTSYDIGKNENR